MSLEPRYSFRSEPDELELLLLCGVLAPATAVAASMASTSYLARRSIVSGFSRQDLEPKYEALEEELPRLRRLAEGDSSYSVLLNATVTAEKPEDGITLRARRVRVNSRGFVQSSWQIAFGHWAGSWSLKLSSLKRGSCTQQANRNSKCMILDVLPTLSRRSLVCFWSRPKIRLMKGRGCHALHDGVARHLKALDVTSKCSSKAPPPARYSKAFACFLVASTLHKLRSLTLPPCGATLANSLEHLVRGCELLQIFRSQVHPNRRQGSAMRGLPGIPVHSELLRDSPKGNQIEKTAYRRVRLDPEPLVPVRCRVEEL
ncbi:hypothetical protein HPB52_012127 [Rhipicephalus sanguineus]|uniref:Uncharacterized protein n=1 Tax=Rhipicephalus sanguineus TaxID=34632 RepID=A0A9D4QAS9_RHISA|nr:hypothetical protein HPB52_012127 [Rhipicephalus sanguineus]